MRYLRACAQLSIVSAVGLHSALAGRAAASSTRNYPLASSPFSSIRFSNPLFQSPFKSKSAAAAEPDNNVAEQDSSAGAVPQDSNIVAVYVTVPDLELGVLFLTLSWSDCQVLSLFTWATSQFNHRRERARSS